LISEIGQSYDAAVWFSDVACAIMVPYVDEMDGSPEQLTERLGLIARLNYGRGLARYGLAEDGREVELCITSLLPAKLAGVEFFARLLGEAERGVALYEKLAWGERVPARSEEAKSHGGLEDALTKLAGALRLRQEAPADHPGAAG